MRGFIESGTEFKNKNGYKAKVQEELAKKQSVAKDTTWRED